ncbi:hypothetical protein ASG36_16285 [Geodermatophilus sp. Leaf369]|uniref:lipopolysaccharide biosynthesis protein n=1 Tax=Geodermatophilus sp. Leaf369 TaxID=1736354 RepID=UPI0006F6CDCE|nr:hypothetical protein [Geodermatophilus sp. Leaf369]KQS58091.1 hypothetical protein ASG36_16285 [Geodermatophilus sp. Leaf369]
MGELTASTSRRSALSLSWVALCIVGSGALTYGYLAIVARNLSGGEYGGFGAFWSMSLIVGFGAFLPVELELARRLSARRSAGLPALTTTTICLLVVGCLVALGAAAPLLVPAFAGDRGTLAPLGLLVLVSAGQFLLRGLLLGTGRLQTHGTLLLIDSVLRVALAVGVSLVFPSAGQTAFAWTLVVAAALTHLPLLAWTRLRPQARSGVKDSSDVSAGPGRSEVDERPFPSAVAHLLVGSLAAQVLLNSSPVLIASVADAAEAPLAAAYVATFTLVRLPLFVAVPLQSALVPVIIGARERGGPSAVRRLVIRTLAATAAAGAAALALGASVGPWVVSVLFGAQYALSRPETGLLALGAGLHLGLLVLSQVLVSAGRQRRVAVVWTAGLSIGSVVFWALPDLVLRASLAFTVGSGAALIVSAAFLVSTSQPLSPDRAPDGPPREKGLTRPRGD